MVESNNGQSARCKSRRHNAKRCLFAKRQAIIYMLANDESVESIRRSCRVSRHNVLAIREQYPQEIKEAQKRIKALIEGHCVELALKALEKWERRIECEHSSRKLLKIVDALEAKVKAFDEPVKTRNPYPLSIKLAALRRAKRNEFPSA